MTSEYVGILGRAQSGLAVTDTEALSLADCTDLRALMRTAAGLRDAGHGSVVTFSRKVFIPLTRLCRDVCSYCTFAHPPQGGAAFLGPEEVVAIARKGAEAGCREALFTLGDKPELRYAAARSELSKLGFASTLAYLRAMASLVLKETGLLPHLNPGVMTLEDIVGLREISVSQGIMFESSSDRLCERGGPHFGSPDKVPAVRLATIKAAGEARVPFTSGILIGIGETRCERVEALLALRALHRQYGHLQEVIVQNFRAKPNTRMAKAPEPSDDDQLWTVAMARIIMGSAMNVQAPPNLSPRGLHGLVDAGINDWGGVSPVTPDHVNPEAPWPALDALAVETERAGKTLVERLATYPSYVRNAEKWLDKRVHTPVLRASDSEGFARPDSWLCGSAGLPPRRRRAPTEPVSTDIRNILSKASDGGGLSETEIVRLFSARGRDFSEVCNAANRLRESVSGDVVRYVVTRNINYTNICGYRCQFCAFSKGKLSDNLRGRPYNLDLDEIQRRAKEAWDRGATEVCMQGGVHPQYTGATYLAISRAVKEATPAIHLHAFSPLEVWQGARTLGVSLKDYLKSLRDAGLASLPGTAAEVLDDSVRAIICPDKITTEQWLEVIRTAHEIGLRSTATIMFGHVDEPVHWARHLLRLRALQAATGGFTEFVPLPFVPMETPIYLKGRARMGPTYREAVAMHAIARLVLHPHITNVQTSWVKMGVEGAMACLRAGANDLGGTLMNESITRAAGAEHGQEMLPEEMDAIIRSIDRVPQQRTTLYGDAPRDRALSSYNAPPTAPIEPAKHGVKHSQPQPQ